jgi:hypothetical protein
LGFLLSVSFHWYSITGKRTKIIIIFITGLHSKPQGCVCCGALHHFKKNGRVVSDWTLFLIFMMGEKGCSPSKTGYHCYRLCEPKSISVKVIFKKCLSPHDVTKCNALNCRIKGRRRSTQTRFCTSTLSMRTTRTLDFTMIDTQRYFPTTQYR